MLLYLQHRLFMYSPGLGQPHHIPLLFLSVQAREVNHCTPEDTTTGTTHLLDRVFVLTRLVVPSTGKGTRPW